MAAISPALTSSPSQSPTITEHNPYTTLRDVFAEQASGLDNAKKSHSWHFPGPSTKYHSSERTRPAHHTRFKSTYTPIAPKLSTERRAAHRRAQSYSAQLSTPGSEPARSPLARFPSYTQDTMAGRVGEAPITPTARHDRRTSAEVVRDSPFSDYFTDDARSTTKHDNDVFDPDAKHALEKQQLLVRLAKLQGELMRGENDANALKIVEGRLDEIEFELGGMHAQTKPPADIGDSGLFMDDSQELSQDRSTNGNSWMTSLPLSSTLDGAADESPNSPTPGATQPKEQMAVESVPANGEANEGEVENNQRQNDALLHELRRVLAAVTEAQKQLRQRHSELKELNDHSILQIEERDQQIEELRCENEALRSDLGFDHSELLFLKLQLKALEVEVDDSPNGNNENVQQNPGQSMTRSRRQTLVEELDRWRGDWDDVETRFRHRREKYGVVEKARRDSLVIDELKAKREGEGEWQIETIKKGSGKRVQSITIKRTHSSGVGMFLENDAVGGADQKSPRPVEADYNDNSTQTQEEEPVYTFSPHDLQTPREEWDPREFALATSSDEEDDSQDDEEDKYQSQSFTASAWQELWNGMADFAGVGEGRFD